MGHAGDSSPTASEPSPPGTPGLRVVGFGDGGDATPRAARRRSVPPPESPLAALLRSNSSFPCLPSLSIRRPKSPACAGVGGGSGEGSPTPARGERLSRSLSSGPVAIPPVR